jgi:hypothetical protein
MPLRQLVRVTIVMFDGQKLIFRDVTEVDPNNSHDVSRLDESRVRIVTLAHGDVEMDGRLIESVAVEGDGAGQYFEMTHTGLREVEKDGKCECCSPLWRYAEDGAGTKPCTVKNCRPDVRRKPGDIRYRWVRPAPDAADALLCEDCHRLWRALAEEDPSLAPIEVVKLANPLDYYEHG